MCVGDLKERRARKVQPSTVEGRESIMSKTTDLLRTVGVFNDHGFFNGSAPSEQVWVAYTGADNGRAGHPAHATVYRRDHKTDPDGPVTA